MGITKDISSCVVKNQYFSRVCSTSENTDIFTTQEEIYTDPHFQRKMFQECNFINIRGLAVIIVPFRGYVRLSPNQVMIKRE